jgi:exodeoxyribonuclease VII small subunit
MVRAMAESETPSSFEHIVTRLEAIAAHLEAGDVQLEQALRLFEEGVGLSKQGTQRLDEAERRLEVLLADGQTQALATDAGAPAGTPNR